MFLDLIDLMYRIYCGDGGSPYFIYIYIYRERERERERERFKLELHISIVIDFHKI